MLAEQENYHPASVAQERPTVHPLLTDASKKLKLDVAEELAEVDTVLIPSPVKAGYRSTEWLFCVLDIFMLSGSSGSAGSKRSQNLILFLGANSPDRRLWDRRKPGPIPSLNQGAGICRGKP